MSESVNKSANVLAHKHRAATLPVGPTIVGWLFFDRIGAPGWAWGVLGTLGVIVWVACIYGVFTQVERSPVWTDPEDES